MTRTHKKILSVTSVQTRELALISIDREREAQHTATNFPLFSMCPAKRRVKVGEVLPFWIYRNSSLISYMFQTNEVEM